MKALSRTQFGNPILRTKARPVPITFLKSPAFGRLIKDMFYTMRQAKGVGLAAPQVGWPIRLAVISVSAERLGNKNYPALRRILLNPRITKHSTKKEPDWEGCLSFTDARGVVPRWSTITIEYINEKGEYKKEKHSGFAARVFQHEIDHLNGVVYVDRMTSMKTLMTYKEFVKRVVQGKS